MNIGKIIKFNILSFIIAMIHPALLGARTNQSLYNDPFDLGAGGANLTRASYAGILFANPAQLAYGDAYIKWAGNQLNVYAGKDSIEQVQNLAQPEDTEESDTAESEDNSLFTQLFETPVHFGLANSLSFLTSKVALGAFARFEPDIKAIRHDEFGLPAFRVRADAFGGLLLGTSQKLSQRWAIGGVYKYLYKAEPDIQLGIADQQQLQTYMDDPATLQSEVTPGYGQGIDLGLLFFNQGKVFDQRFAIKVDDLGDTSFSEDQEPFKQMLHAGLGLTFHGAVNSLHISADVRDILGAYEEPLSLRLYSGAKLILQNYVGISMGYYQGNPSWGFHMDLVLVKIGFTSYTREMGEYSGEDRRPIYVAQVSIGG